MLRVIIIVIIAPLLAVRRFNQAFIIVKRFIRVIRDYTPSEIYCILFSLFMSSRQNENKKKETLSPFNLMPDAIKKRWNDNDFLRYKLSLRMKHIFRISLCLADLHIVTKIYGLSLILRVQVYIH